MTERYSAVATTDTSHRYISDVRASDQNAPAMKICPMCIANLQLLSLLLLRNPALHRLLEASRAVPQPPCWASEGGAFGFPHRLTLNAPWPKCPPPPHRHSLSIGLPAPRRVPPLCPVGRGYGVVGQGAPQGLQCVHRELQHLPSLLQQ